MVAGVLVQLYKVKLLNSGVLMVNFEQISHVVTVLLLLILSKSMPTGRILLRFSNEHLFVINYFQENKLLSRNSTKNRSIKGTKCCM